MSFGFNMKPSKNVPDELITKFDILQTPVIHVRSELSKAVFCKFLTQVTAITDRLGTLLKMMNVSIITNEEDKVTHDLQIESDLSKSTYIFKKLLPHVANDSYL